jgi:hypothetical protein
MNPPTLPYSLGGLFGPLFDWLAGVSDNIYDTLSYFTYLLAFLGLIICAYKTMMGGDLSTLGTQLVTTVVVAVLLQVLPTWLVNSQEMLGWAMIENMDMDIELVTITWVATVSAYLVGQTALFFVHITGAVAGGFLIVPGIIELVYAIITFLVIVFVTVLAVFVWALPLAAYLIQFTSIVLGIATLPLFLGMFLFPTSKETAIRYFTGLFGIMLWPLGWAIGYEIVGMVTNITHTIFVGSLLFALDAILSGVAGAILVYIEAQLFFTVIKKGPQLITKAITTGTQIGAGLVSAGIASAASSVSNSVSAAGSVASTAVSAAGSGAGAAIGGVASGGNPAGAAAGAGIGGAVGGAAGGALGGAASAAAGGIQSAGAGLAEMGEGA